MYKDERDLLDVLRKELRFFESGGYSREPRQPWRFQHIFEDSPACMNFDSGDNPGPCSNCTLMQLVPAEFRASAVPCRHIPLNAEAETLDSLYRYADGREINETYGKWLRTTIARLEQDRRALRSAGTKPSAPGRAETKGEALFQQLHPKCANPACAAAFQWFDGGKFFRFRQDAPDVAFQQAEVPVSSQTDGVKHYWLCEHCSHVFTLVYDEDQGVVLKLRWPELVG